VQEKEKIEIELLFSEPEIIAWLEGDWNDDDLDDPSGKAVRGGGEMRSRRRGWI